MLGFNSSPGHIVSVSRIFVFILTAGAFCNPLTTPTNKLTSTQRNRLMDTGRLLLDPHNGGINPVSAHRPRGDQ